MLLLTTGGKEKKYPTIWCNGSHKGLKNPCLNGREGSSPSIVTNFSKVRITGSTDELIPRVS